MLIKQILIAWGIGFGVFCAGFHFGHEKAVLKNLVYSQSAEISAATDALKKVKEATVVLAAAQEDFTKGVLSDQKAGSAVLNSINAGTRRLSVSIKASTTNPASGGSDSTSGNGEIRAELSDEANRFFISEAERANKVVRTLNLCQKTLETLKQVEK